jgi:hypothetical protein
LDIDPKESKSTLKRNTCTAMFITALFTIAKLWKQPRCPTTNEQIQKMWDIYVNKNEIISSAGEWVGLEIIMLSEISQAQKVKRVFTYMQNLDS